MDNSPQQDQSSFVSGFTIGLFAGAAGYFLFGTKRGAQIRRQLAEEWEDAQEHLSREGMVQPGVSLRDFFQDLLHTTVKHSETMILEPIAERVESVTKKAAPKMAKKKPASKKFRGV